MVRQRIANPFYAGSNPVANSNKKGKGMKMFDFKHLQKAGATYFEHLFYAVYFSCIALLVFITGVIHAFFPFMFGFLPYKLAKKITDGTEKNFKSTED